MQCPYCFEDIDWDTWAADKRQHIAESNEH